MKRFIFSFLFIFSFSFADDLEKIIKKYYYSKIDFIQKTYIQELDDFQEFIGSIYIKKLEFKVEYKSPYRQIIFVKDDGIYIYDIQENQLVITPASQNFIILNILDIISGKVKINDFFKIKKINENVYNLESENHLEIKEIKIFVDDNNIKKIDIIDKENNKVELIIKSVIFDKNFNLDLKLPENVNVIDYRYKKE